MKYLIIGAGGTGGAIGAFMAKQKYDVTLIARGQHLDAIKNNGLTIVHADNSADTFHINASSMVEYNDSPDVIFICVKGYSLDETIPFIQRIINKNTVIIPILNIYGTGGKLQKHFPDNLVTDGCIYVAAQIKESGVIWMNGDILRVVYGVRKPEEYSDILELVKEDLMQAGIEPILSDNIRRDALQKFSYVSPAASCGQFYDVTAGDMQKSGIIRDTFVSLIREIDILAKAMGIYFDVDIVKTNLSILDKLSPEASTSMQRDVKAGKKSEMDGLIFEVIRLAKEYNVSLPLYEKIATEMKKRGF